LFLNLEFLFVCLFVCLFVLFLVCLCISPCWFLWVFVVVDSFTIVN
jgi:hypothetical protein